MKKLYYGLIALIALFPSKTSADVLHEVKGVSKELALSRKSVMSDIVYNLDFTIPENRDSAVLGKESIGFVLKKIGTVVLDFKESEDAVRSVAVNGKPVKYIFENEHLTIASKYTQEGKNNVSIDFVAGNQSLNRQDEYLYTLLVPDRARTLFPCFDQPDLKARYNLTLNIPFGWEGVANGKIKRERKLGVSGKIVEFAQTEPIPTYLFSFVAGKLNKVTQKKDGREVSLYHRETDQQKTEQCAGILSEVFHSLEWLEGYTGIKYPFAKYDLIILPGFQYGGMEHMGATLYSDRTMFLDKNPTIEERLSRSSLIAHETAHMWFGDYVTMKWFDDVWTKEVFANYFAAAIVAPQYPEINHKFNFINSYYPSAYSEERTLGTNPVQQELDNLDKAGLVYGNIIYNKAPVVMEMLVKRIGEGKFREGIRKYLSSYAYSNATWDNLIEILDGLTDENLRDWSNVWIKEKGMPQISSERMSDKIVIHQSDRYGRNLIWKQPLEFWLTDKDGDLGQKKVFHITLDSSYSILPLSLKDEVIIPNTDGYGYGYFKLDSISSGWLMGYLASAKDTAQENIIFKESILISLNENFLNKNLNRRVFMNSLTKYARTEKNTLLFSRALSYITNAYIRFMSVDGADTSLENELWSIVTENANPQKRLLALRAYIDIAASREAIDKLYNLWRSPEGLEYVSLGERDLIRLSYELSISMPDKYNEITSTQLSRISNPDRKREYRFIMPSLSPEKAVRDSVFNSLLDVRNREVEPWAASALSYLNHYKRDCESIYYILPGLALMDEIQRTGDIFFPRNWSRALLGGHRTIESAKIVDDFLDKHKDMDTKLVSKIRQQL